MDKDLKKSLILGGSLAATMVPISCALATNASPELAVQVTSAMLLTSAGLAATDFALTKLGRFVFDRLFPPKKDSGLSLPEASTPRENDKINTL